MPKQSDKAKIYPYSEDFPKLFKAKKEEILESYDDCEIHHIGSTAVEGLGGKGIIDILITINNWDKEKDLLKALEKLGYTHIHERENGRRFVSKEPSNVGYKDFHIHIVKKGNKEYEKVISFRDYLRENPDKAEEYFKIKKKAEDLPLSTYNEKKNEFFKKIKGLKQ